MHLQLKEMWLSPQVGGPIIGGGGGEGGGLISDRL